MAAAISDAAFPRCRLAPDSRIKLIGLGGVGGLLLEPLVIFLHSLGQPTRLVLVDGDRFESANRQRMKFAELGNKAAVKAAEVASLCADGEVTIVSVPEFVTPDNIVRLVREGDHVLLCVDNHATRRLVSEHCQSLENVMLLSGGNDGIEPPEQRGTYGNAQIAIRRHGEDVTAPLTRFHPEIAHANGHFPGGPNCGQLARSTPQVLMTNLAVASHMLNLLFAYLCGELAFQEVQFDILTGRALPQFPIASDRINALMDATE